MMSFLGYAIIDAQSIKIKYNAKDPSVLVKGHKHYIHTANLSDTKSCL